MSSRSTRLPRLSDARIVLAYAVVAGAWILLSDQVAVALFADPGVQATVATIKGWAFVLATALLLAALLRRYSAERARQQAGLVESERLFRLFADRAQDILFRYRLTDPEGFVYVSPSAIAILGYPADTFLSQPGFLSRIVHPDDVELLPTGRPDEYLPHGAAVMRVRHLDGHWVPLELHTTAYTVDGAEMLEGVARDVSDRRRAETELTRANGVLRTLSEANRALVHAENEDALLTAICTAIVDHAGFLLAWVGYAEHDRAGTVRPAARAGADAGYVDGLGLSWHDGEAAAGPTGIAIREARTVVTRTIGDDPSMDRWRVAAAERGYASSAAIPLVARSGVLGALSIYAAEPDAFGPSEVALFEELAADLAYGVETLRERAAAAAAESERRLLAAAVAQTNESVMITDVQGRIEYVNPAFERVTGYAREEVVGQTPRILKSGVQPAAFYDAMWRALADGRPWVADFVNRRKDGTLFTEEAVISAVHDAGSRTTGFVAVKRDVTGEREAEARAQAQARERTLVAEALAAIHPQASPEETADALCQQVVRLPEAAVALLLAFDPDGRATPLAGVTATSGRIELRPLPEDRAGQLRARAQEGPWVEGWIAERGHPHNRAFRQLEVRGLAYAPLVVDRQVVGLLEFGTADPDAAARLTERLPALAEFAAIAGAVLGSSLSRRARASGSRERVRRIIEQRRFRPVFQPIIDLETLAAVGYEALTRFEDGIRPDEQFREAASVGLGVELEIAALREALAAAAALPETPWLNVNVSPAVILAGEPLATLLAGHPGALVLEVTEHEAIADYEAFRAAVAHLTPRVRVAVDDAGAGFASMRHILELRPDFVKIDRSLVAGLESDVARQALLAGLRHFAESVGCGLIAEGIETEAELATLRRLGLRTGQGYLLGRPVPLVAADATAPGSVTSIRRPGGRFGSEAASPAP